MSIQKVPNLNAVTTEDVRSFWQANPLCVASNPYEPGTTEFFDFYNTQREAIESIPYSYALHEYCDFRGKKVLDVGSGNGYVLSKYATEGAEVFGIDITQFDGLGNPKGVVSSRKELRARLHRFSDIRMHVGFLDTTDIILRGARFLPNRLFQPLASLLGWNLYAKARKPS